MSLQWGHRESVNGAGDGYGCGDADGQGEAMGRDIGSGMGAGQACGGEVENVLRYTNEELDEIVEPNSLTPCYMSDWGHWIPIATDEARALLQEGYEYSASDRGLFLTPPEEE